MPTPEERLAQLERAQADTNHNITMLVGVIGEQGRDIKRIASTLEQHTALLQQILQKLDEGKS